MPDRSRKDSESTSRFPFAWGASLYSMAFGFTFLLGGRRLWDDTDFYAPNRVGRDAVLATGSPPWRAWIEFDLLGAEPVAFRIATFAAYFLSAWLMYEILVRTPRISTLQARVASLLFLLAPVNSARVAMVMTFTALSTLTLLVGWRLLLSASRSIKSLGLTALLAAMSVAAIQPLIGLVIGHQLYLRWSSGRDMRRVTTYSPLALLALPILAEILNAAFWPPTGSYSQYYAIRPQGVLRATLLLVVAFGLLILLVIRRARVSDAPVLAGVGGVALALGAFAYLVGGHLVGIAQWLLPLVPENSDWESRHTALLGIGIGLIGAGFVRDPVGRARRSGLTSGTHLAVALFVLLNLTFSLEYVRDGIEKHDFVREARTTIDLDSARSIVVLDRTLGSDARGRVVRDEEWLALLREAGWSEIEFVFRSGRGDCHPEPPTDALVIAMTSGRLSILLQRDTDLWLKVEPYDEREHGVTYISNQPGTAGWPCVG